MRAGTITLDSGEATALAFAVAYALDHADDAELDARQIVHLEQIARALGLRPDGAEDSDGDD